LETLGWRETQKGSVNHPISYVVIRTSPSINPFLNLLRKMGVAEEDDLIPF
jgi:hypothetical protein